MTNPITEARSDIKTELENIEGLQVFDYVPSAMTAPAAVVTPGEPYVIPGRVMGEYAIALNVRLFAKTGTNEVVTNGLDDLIVSVCEALQGYGVRSVSRPGVDRESYDMPYLVTDIAINTTYKEGS